MGLIDPVPTSLIRMQLYHCRDSNGSLMNFEPSIYYDLRIVACNSNSLG
jgi:hypothetical protein